MDNVNEMPGLLIMCAHCHNKIMRDGKYYCNIAGNELGNDEVTPNMDASRCVKNGWFK